MASSSAPQFQPIADPAQVDLTRHALVEASAGTGKTYTIENLVVRLLQTETDLFLENILLVTFTEKATSELKERIRQKIEDTLKTDRNLAVDVRKKLTDTLDAFDSAPITTIHGFCHRLLQEFPFETGNPFQQEVIDDRPLLERLLRVQMRSQWPERYGDRLELLLDLANFSADPDRFIRTAVSLVQQFSSDLLDHTLVPDPDDLNIDELWQQCRQTVLAVKPLVSEPPGLADGYARLNIHARTKSAIVRDLITPIQDTMELVDEDNWRPLEIKAVVDALGKKHISGLRNVDRLVPDKWLKSGENVNACPHLPAIQSHLGELVRLFDRMKHLLAVNAVAPLRQAVGAMKAQHGWISYQDMVAHVAEFLAGKGSDEGIRRIRRRYRVAFVDEFQDTDDLQWRIFRTLFLETFPGEPPNRLFIIGDPKQAIYAFRGADVFTYLDARRRLKELAGKKMANLYALSVNWRSIPRLVDAFNNVFGCDEWFGKDDDENPYAIGYGRSSSPPEEEQRTFVRSDQSGRPVFNVMDLTAAHRHTAAKSLLGGFICREIHELVEKGRIRYSTGQETERKLDYGDIAVLVRSRSEFSLIEPLFQEAAIPFTYYRKPGLFQCREAYWLSVILHAVARPQRFAVVKRALLTPFFDRSADELLNMPELPVGHEIQRLLMAWNEQGRTRCWGGMFQSLLEDSGMMLRHCTDPGWERTQTNLGQLCEYLENAAYLQNLDLDGMAALLDALCQSRIDAGQDADIHRIEDESGKVQILTMHVAKGLEFPVVFVAGGLTVPMPDGPQIYHRTDPEHAGRGCRKVIDLTAATGGEQAAMEREDEDKRLFYVALTRARIKLYIPYFPTRRSHLWEGPVCSFVSTAIQAAFSKEQDTKTDIGWHLVGDLPSDLGAISWHNEIEEAVGKLPAGALLPGREGFRNRKLSLESFSSIAHRLDRTQASSDGTPSFRLFDAGRREADEPAEQLLDPPTHFGPPDPAEELPGGTRMGSMFHYVFENIDFHLVTDGPEAILEIAPVRRTIAAAMALYRIESHWTPVVARIVANVLRLPIDLDGTSLVLGELKGGHRRHEIEFHFPLLAPLEKGVIVPGWSPDAGSCGETVLRGFIDLVFQWNGIYYIADWKSNRLADGYNRPAMEREIQAAGYDLQYRLYTIATLRWLRQQLGDAFDPERHFGGALYVFIRGIQPGSQEGIFHVRAGELLPADLLEASVREQIVGLQ